MPGRWGLVPRAPKAPCNSSLPGGQRTVEAFPREKGRGHVVCRGARFLISSTRANKRSWKEEGRSNVCRLLCFHVASSAYDLLLRSRVHVRFILRSLRSRQLWLLNTKATPTARSFVLLCPSGRTDSHAPFQKSRENIALQMSQTKAIFPWPALLRMKCCQRNSQA